MNPEDSLGQGRPEFAVMRRVRHMGHFTARTSDTAHDQLDQGCQEEAGLR